MNNLKLYEIIVTYEYYHEIYKLYRFYYNLKTCKKYIESYGMEIVRIRKIDNIYYISSYLIR